MKKIQIEKRYIYQKEIIDYFKKKYINKKLYGKKIYK